MFDNYEISGEEIVFDAGDDFDLVKIFECGQCFRWNMDGDGAYKGVAFGRAARLRSEDGKIYITGSDDDFINVWRDYFDLDRDYGSIRKSLCIDEYMCRATEFGAGIRILRQEKWEALCSFIISQCNNIPRIKKIVETLCREFGEELTLFGDTYYSFPPAELVSNLTEKDLAPLRCGYRAPYIIGAAKAVQYGDIDLEMLSNGDPADALRALKKLNGVGDKVANCVVLFGLQMLDAFPIDVWMKKAIAEHYGAGFKPAVFSPFAGIAQQYMFYYARSGEEK